MAFIKPGVGTGLTAGGAILTSGGSPFITGRLRLRDKITAADAGCLFNGDDETSKLQDILGWCQDNHKPFEFIAGESPITAQLLVDPTKPINVSGLGGLTRLIHAYDGPLFWPQGSLTDVTTITAPSAVGDQQITVGTTVGLGPGSIVVLRDPTYPIIGAQGSIVGDARAVGGQPALVRKVDSTHIYFYGKLKYPFTVGSDVRLLQPIRCSFKNFDIVNASNIGDSSVSRAIYLRYNRASVIKNVNTDHMGGTSFYDWGGFNNRVLFCDFDNGQDAEQEDKGLGDDGKPQGPYPYGVVGGRGTWGLLVLGCTQTGGRHLYTTASSPTEIPPQEVKVQSCLAEFMWHAAFDTHPGSGRHVFADCRASSGSILGIYDTEGDPQAARLRAFGYGFQLRGPDQHVIDCFADDCIVGAVFANAADGGSVMGGRFKNCDQGVRVRNSNNIRAGGGLIIDNPSLDGIYFETIDPNWRSWVTESEIDDVTVRGNPSGAAITYQTNGHVPGHRITPRFRAPNATTKVSGMTYLPGSVVGSTLTVPW